MHSCQAFTRAGVLQPRARSTPRASRLERACTQRRTLVRSMRTHAHSHARPQEHTRTHVGAHARPASTNGPQGLAASGACMHPGTHAHTHTHTLVHGSGCTQHTVDCVPGGTVSSKSAERQFALASKLRFIICACGRVGCRPPAGAEL